MSACVTRGYRCHTGTAEVSPRVSPPSYSPPDLEAELQLDRLKPRPSRRVLLLKGHQSSKQKELVVAPGTPPVCSNLTAYLRVRPEEQRGRGRGQSMEGGGQERGCGISNQDGDRDWG